MSRISSISVLLLLLMAVSAAAYEYRMPVNIQSTITPAVLMPGDEALVALELQNGAAAYGIGETAGISHNAQGTILSTPINETILSGTDEIQVTTPGFKDLGMIGPTDRITIYYKIRASDDITSGTYLLNFKVLGGYSMTAINREIPVKVDSSAVSIARADVPTKPSMSLNVANPRENTINAVTIVPDAPGIRFSPDRYYIGTMDPDEVFTISFGIDSGDHARPVRGPVNLSFISEFKNGDNWHKSEAYVASYSPPVDGSNKESYMLPAGATLLVLLAGGYYLYRRRKSSNKKA